MASMALEVLRLVVAVQRACEDAGAAKRTVRVIGEKMELLAHVLRELHSEEVAASAATTPSPAVGRVLRELGDEIRKTRAAVEKAARMGRAVYLLRSRSIREDLDERMRRVQFSLAALEAGQSEALRREVARLHAGWVARDRELRDEAERERHERDEIRRLVERGDGAVAGAAGVAGQRERDEAVAELERETEALRRDVEGAADEVARAKAALERDAMEQLAAALRLVDLGGGEAGGGGAAEPPEWCRCPVTLDVMTDPVIVGAVCHHTVNRGAFNDWIGRGHISCPVCGVALQSSQVSPNVPLRDAIAHVIGDTGRQPAGETLAASLHAKPPVAAPSLQAESPAANPPLLGGGRLSGAFDPFGVSDALPRAPTHLSLPAPTTASNPGPRSSTGNVNPYERPWPSAPLSAPHTNVGPPRTNPFDAFERPLPSVPSSAAHPNAGLPQMNPFDPFERPLSSVPSSAPHLPPGSIKMSEEDARLFHSPAPLHASAPDRRAVPQGNAFGRQQEFCSNDNTIYGVDLGTQNSAIAALGPGLEVNIRHNDSKRLLFRSSSCEQSDYFCPVGLLARRDDSISNHHAVSIKRLVGLAFDDPRAQREMRRAPFACVPTKRGAIRSISVVVFESDGSGGRLRVPVEVLAGMMVRSLGDAVPPLTAAPAPPRDWVVAVPGYYTDSQRRALLAGCESAGVEGVRCLLHETTATALAYGEAEEVKRVLSTDEPKNVMFVDMGAASYSVSIVSFYAAKMVVKSTRYDTNLGGRDFDQIIAEWIAKQFDMRHNHRLRCKLTESPLLLLKLLVAAEKAKKALSSGGVYETQIRIESLVDSLDFAVTFKVDEYDHLSAPLLSRLALPIVLALSDANLTSKDLYSVEVVGGGTRIRGVMSEISRTIGINPFADNLGLGTTLNAEEAVAKGAALKSAQLSPHFNKASPFEIIEYQPYSINISWTNCEGDGADNVNILDRGLYFPIVRRVTLRRSADFDVVLKYAELPSSGDISEWADTYHRDGVSNVIATITIKVPPGTNNNIRVNVKCDIHGILSLSSAQMVEELPDKRIKKTCLDFTTRHPIECTTGN